MRIILLLTFVVSFFITSVAYSMSDVTAHFTLNGTADMKMKPGAPAVLEIHFTDNQTGEIEKDFKVMHGKIMHVVIFKDDLAVFKHVHPYLDPVTGRFQITLNMPHSDPDNFHAEYSLLEPGNFKVMADVEIKGKGMRMGHTQINVDGDAQTHTLELDATNGNSTITKYIHASGQEQSEKPKYQTILSQKVTAGCSGILLEWNLNLKSLKDGKYQKIDTIQPWLSMGGHSIVISEGIKNAHNKMAFGHMHAKMPTDNENFLFNLYDAELLNPGKQKIWFQIKDGSKVLTIPFVYDYFPPQLDPTSC